VEVHEHTNTRTLPEALYGVVTLDEYLVCACCLSTAGVAVLTPAPHRAGTQHVVQYAMAEVGCASAWRATRALTRRARQTERVRLKGTRFLKLASLCPCVLLFLVRGTLRVTSPAAEPRNADAAAGSVLVAD
jgi:hypothetical protein